MLIAYLISVVLLALLLIIEWAGGIKTGYKFSIKEYLGATFMILCPIVNTLFACFLIVEHLHN